MPLPVLIVTTTLTEHAHALSKMRV